MRGPIDPIDHDQDARRRLRARRSEQRYLGSVAALAAQLILSLPAGAWAAHIADADGGQTVVIGAVAMAFAVAAAFGLARLFGLATGAVMVAVGLPALFRKLTSSPPPPPPPAQVAADARERRAERVLHGIATLIHALALLAAAVLIATLISVLTATPWFALCWRFALAAALLSLLTWPALKVTLA